MIPEEAEHHTIFMGLSWNIKEGVGAMDVDASCVKFTSEGRLIEGIYFQNPEGKEDKKSNHSIITHKGDNLTGKGEGFGMHSARSPKHHGGPPPINDDERVEIRHLAQLRRHQQRCTYMFFVINVFSAAHKFEHLKDMTIRIVDEDTGGGTEICRFSKSEMANSKFNGNGFVLGCLSWRAQRRQWAFQVIDEAYDIKEHGTYRALEPQLMRLCKQKKELEGSLKDIETAIEDAKSGVLTLKEEIDALGDGIRALDKQVEDGTEQRKEEASDYQSLMASDAAAKQLLEFAKNRLNKFYNPKLYKAPPKRELSDEDRATLAAGGTLAPTEAPGGIQGTGVEIPALVQKADPGPAPEAPKAYSKKSEESGGIIAMIDLLIKDLDKEMTEAEFTEKDAQEDYETFMKDSAQKRAEDSKSLSDKEGTKADLQASLQENDAAKTSTVKELMATEEYISTLHGDCDWLIKYFDVRQEARTNEIDAMQKAKAILSGADFGFFIQKNARFDYILV